MMVASRWWAAREARPVVHQARPAAPGGWTPLPEAASDRGHATANSWLTGWPCYAERQPQPAQGRRGCGVAPPMLGGAGTLAASPLSGTQHLAQRLRQAHSDEHACLGSGQAAGRLYLRARVHGQRPVVEGKRDALAFSLGSEASLPFAAARPAV